MQWTQNLETGVEWQDTQHRELFQKMADVAHAADQKLGSDALRRYMSFLDSYVVVHFEAEERAMREKSYPGLAHHLAEHQEFKRQMDELRADIHEYCADGVVGSQHITVALLRSYEWFRKHITKTDRDLAAFLKA